MTRTALIMNGLAEFRIRSTRQGAKAPFKPKKQNQLLIYQSIFLKKPCLFPKNMVEYNQRKEATKMAEQKNYKFLIVINHEDCTNTKVMESMTTKEARDYARKLAQLHGIDSVELYRIDKTEIFA